MRGAFFFEANPRKPCRLTRGRLLLQAEGAEKAARCSARAEVQLAMRTERG